MGLLEYVGQALRRERKLRGMSQAELATLAGLHPTTISLLESGRMNISVKRLESLMKVLEMDRFELIINQDENLDEVIQKKTFELLKTVNKEGLAALHQFLMHLRDS